MFASGQVKMRRIEGWCDLGETAAVAAVVMAMAFVTVDLGRPDRLWHLLPGIGDAMVQKITSLVIRNKEGRVDGIIHLHDLWRTEMF